MTGAGMVGLMLFSMAWLFYVLGVAMNAYSWWRAQRVKEGERVPSGVLFFFGIFGAFIAYFSINVLEGRYGVEVSWPWFWILLPLFLDMYCGGAFVAALFFKAFRKSRSPCG